MEKQQLDGDRIFLLRGFLSPEECAYFIALAEKAGFDPAPVDTGDGPVLDRDLRDSARLAREDRELASLLWRRAIPFMPPAQGAWQPVGLSESFRFYRYDPGQKFNRHFDGYVETPDGRSSHLTLLIYLNDDFEGGETRFFPFHLDEPVTVKPQAGTALLFLHRQLHEGAAVLSGRKYVLRTDVMYRHANPPAVLTPDP